MIALIANGINIVRVAIKHEKPMKEVLLSQRYSPHKILKNEGPTFAEILLSHKYLLI